MKNIQSLQAGALLRQYWVVAFAVVLMLAFAAPSSFAQGKVSRDMTYKQQSDGTINGHEWVDLGLPSGLKWATCNVGASSPGGYGDYFAWGETQTKREYTEAYSITFGKNVSALQSEGVINGKGVLNRSYDAASDNWGSTWRMPTKAEFEELISKCKWKWTKQNGHNGYRVTGPNGKSIFLPAAGWRYGSSLYNAGEYGNYWSSTGFDDTLNAYYRIFYSGGHSTYWLGRYDGQSVRPVTE